MGPDRFPVPSNKLKKLERTWNYFHYEDTFFDQAIGKERTILRCDFPLAENGIIQGWLAVGIDPTVGEEGVYFGGNGWSRTVVAGSLKLALAGIIDKLRQCKLRLRGAETHLATMRANRNRSTLAVKYAEAEVAECRAMAALCQSALSSISEFYQWTESLREPPERIESPRLDLRESIGARLGYSCGPPPPPVEKVDPTHSDAYLSGEEDEGPHASGDAYDAEFDDDGGD